MERGEPAVGNALEALKQDLDRTRAEYGTVYRRTLWAQNKSLLGRVGTSEKIARKKSKNKKGPGEAPARLVDESKAPEEYSKARDAYDIAVDAYFSALAEQADAAGLIDAYDAENRLLAEAFEVDGVNRWVNERRARAGTWVSWAVKKTRFDRLAAFVQRKFKESPTVSKIFAAVGVAGLYALALVYPPLLPFVVGFTAGFGTRWLTKWSWKDVATWWREGKGFEKVEAEIAESWNEAQKRGLTFKEWYEQNIVRLRGRAKTIRNSGRAGMAVGLGVGVGSFVATGSGLGRNIAEGALGYSKADLSFIGPIVSSAQAAPTGGSTQNVGYPTDGLENERPRIIPEMNPTFELQTRIDGLYEYFQDEHLRVGEGKRDFLSGLRNLKSLSFGDLRLSPNDQAFLDRVYGAYLGAENHLEEQMHELHGQWLKDYMKLANDMSKPPNERAVYREMIAEKLDEIERGGRGDLQNLQRLQKYITDMGAFARQNPEQFLRRGLDQFRLSSFGSTENVLLASIEPTLGEETGFIEVASGKPAPYNPDLGKTPVTPQNAEILNRIGNMGVGDITGIETYQQFLTEQQNKVTETLKNYTARLELLEKTAQMNTNLSQTDIEVVKGAVAMVAMDAGAEIASRLQGVITGPSTEISVEKLRLRATADFSRITQPVMAIKQQVEALERIAKSGMPNVRPEKDGAISA